MVSAGYPPTDVCAEANPAPNRLVPGGVTFEVKKCIDGSPKCSADNCAGAVRDKSDTRVNLSNTEGVDGTNACDLEAGYEMIFASRFPPGHF